MRSSLALAFLPLALTACDRTPAPPAPSPAAAPSVETKSAAALLRGTWQVDGFEAAAAAPSSSATTLQAQADSEAAKTVRITYTGDQVKVAVPGQPVLSSSYEVKESHPTWCRILNGKDDVFITFTDDDHMTIDRKGNAYGAKMKMRRTNEPAPQPSVVAAGSSSIALPGLPPGAKVQVVGTTSAGNTIVKIGP